MTALNYATFREDVSDAIGEMEGYVRVLEDSKCYLNLAKRSLEYATGTGHECDRLMQETDALILKARQAIRAVRLETGS